MRVADDLLRTPKAPLARIAHMGAAFAASNLLRSAILLVSWWKPGDAASFARALVEAGQRNLTTARAQVGAHFDHALTWSAIGPRAMEIYQDVVSGRRAPVSRPASR
jgi:hypothetical protein